MTLKISRTLTLPLTTVTDPLAILGVRGSGKTTTARRLVEQLTEASQQCVILDPTGAWWGLRSHYPITILGGDHGDLPLQASAAEAIANLVVERHWSVVLDLSHMRKAEMRRFALPFIETLYHRNRTALMLVVDECDILIPQRVQTGMEQLIGAMEDIVRRGRKKGIGCTLISQRPASVHKDVLSQAQILIAHQLTGAHDRRAIKDWVEANGDPEREREMLATIGRQQPGQAWVWGPARDLFGQHVMLPTKSHDSGATPEPGKIEASVPLKAIDLDELRGQFDQLAQQAIENDPKALKARIRELEGWFNDAKDRLEKAVARIEELESHPKVVHQPAALSPRYHECLDRLRELEAEMRLEADEMIVYFQDSPEARAVERRRPEPVVPVEPVPMRVGPKPLPRLVIDANEVPGLSAKIRDITGPERKILTVLAAYGPRTKRQLAMQAGYSANGGGFNNPLGKLRTDEYVTKGQPIEITQLGLAALGEFTPLPRGRELLDYWLSQIDGPMAKILAEVVRMEPVTREALAEATGYAPNGGGFNNPLGRLRTLGLVAKGQPITLTDDFREAIS